MQKTMITSDRKGQRRHDLWLCMLGLWPGGTYMLRLAFGLVSRTCYDWPVLTSSCGEAWLDWVSVGAAAGADESKCGGACRTKTNAMTFVVAVPSSDHYHYHYHYHYLTTI